MKIEKIINIICNLILSGLSVFVIYLFVRFSENNTFLFGDDGYSSLYPYIEEGMFDCLKFNLHGDGYLGLFLSKFFCFGLPNLLGIHPADFMGAPHGFIRGIFASLTFLAISDFVNIFKKSKLLYLSSFILLVILFFDTTLFVTTTVIMCSYNFYRYFFSLFFMSIFLNHIFRSVLFNDCKNGVIRLVIVSASGFIAATSVEINIFSLLMFICLIFMYSLIINKFVKNENILKSFQITTDINFYIPSAFVILAVSAVTLSKSGFQSMAAVRGLGSTIITPDLISSFVKEFINIYFVNNIGIILTITALIVLSLIFAVKNKEIKVIILPVFFLISVFTTLFSLILLGKTNDGDFWLTHPNIIFLYRMLMSFGCLYFMGYIYKNLKFLHNVITSVVIFTVIVSCLIYTIEERHYTDIMPVVDKNLKRKAYIMEKIMRFYLLQNKRPILPKDIMSSYDFGSWNNENPEEFNTRNVINSSYYPRIYKNDISAKLGYEYENDAIKKFYENGGNFSREELENIEFSRLFNEDFVLNKQFSPKELYDLL